MIRAIATGVLAVLVGCAIAFLGVTSSRRWSPKGGWLAAVLYTLFFFLAVIGSMGFEEFLGFRYHYFVLWSFIAFALTFHIVLEIKRGKP